MSKRIIIPVTALVLCFGLMCGANVRTARGLNPLAVPRFQEPDCTDGKKVAKAIYAHLKKHGFTKQQRDRINVFFNPADRVITLSGFVVPPSPAPSKKMVGVNRAGKLVMEATTCETRVDNQLSSFSGGNCTPPRVPCGDTGICLPEAECSLPTKHR